MNDEKLTHADIFIHLFKNKFDKESLRYVEYDRGSRFKMDINGYTISFVVDGDDLNNCILNDYLKKLNQQIKDEKINDVLK